MTTGRTDQRRAICLATPLDYIRRLMQGTTGDIPRIVRYSPRQLIDASRGVNCPLEGRRSSVTAKVLDKSLLMDDHRGHTHSRLIFAQSTDLHPTRSGVSPEHLPAAPPYLHTALAGCHQPDSSRRVSFAKWLLSRLGKVKLSGVARLDPRPLTRRKGRSTHWGLQVNPLFSTDP